MGKAKNVTKFKGLLRLNGYAKGTMNMGKLRVNWMRHRI